MNTKGKQLVRINATKPDMTQIEAIRERLSERDLKTFNRHYGDILDLTKAEVQLGVISSLVQFYDPLLRCFTFQDFQLAPTLEELVLNFSKEKAYMGIGKTVDIKILVEGLKIPYIEFALNHKKEGEVRGIKRCYLEKKLLI